MVRAILSIIFMLAIVLFAAHSCNTRSENDAAGHVAADAVMMMKPDAWQDTYDRLGQSAFDRANRLAPRAAIEAAKRGGCDKVTYLGLSMAATTARLAWFADCENGGRIQISEDELR